MNAHWQVTDLSAKRFSQTNDKSTLSFGSDENCDLRCEYSNERAYAGQIMLESGFYFEINENHNLCHFGRGTLKFGTLNIEFKCHGAFEFFNTNILDIARMSELRKLPEYQLIIDGLRKNALQTSSDTGASEQIFETMAALASEIFWCNNNAGKSDDRHLFIDLVSTVWATIAHFGLLAPLLHNEKITEIMINGTEGLYYEESGIIHRCADAIQCEIEITSIGERMAETSGRRWDDSTPICDTRLADGSRVNLIARPLSCVGPCITIRKFPKKRLELSDLLKRGSIDHDKAEFLKKAVESGLNVIVSGGTGTGKTTLLNVISQFIPITERVVTLEDTAELSLYQPHVVRLESRPPNTEGQGQVTLRDLVKNTLRMRPDRLVIGECRGAEALDLVQALNTGHDGSLATIHANSPLDALRRLEILCLFSGIDLPLRALREQISSAVHIVVQLSRCPDGSRKVTSVSQVYSNLSEGGQYQLTQDLNFIDRYMQ